MCEKVIYPNAQELQLIEEPFFAEHPFSFPELYFVACVFEDIGSFDKSGSVIFRFDADSYEESVREALWVKHKVSKRLPHAYAYQDETASDYCSAAVSTEYGRLEACYSGTDLSPEGTRVSCSKAVRLLEKVYEIGFWKKSPDKYLDRYDDEYGKEFPDKYRRRTDIDDFDTGYLASVDS
ncbi:hypothetical protein UL82_07675 [Corynebacterium kutscheri]|uniref:Uncharacterized protein n=1 Tax=Corynebacterium kutscheri TaxID=35755 RepID=A0A0F6TDZ5_9CORY|nr:hypothetical protein [Corynebacterium kutscheri]AKE41696.1 hypothetical protein UL82_07675 [Corynebacterium kutscheri]VEH10023.1 Uncharacterised protein [Corynebacterium kutscheri]